MAMRKGVNLVYMEEDERKKVHVYVIHLRDIFYLK